jgi:hypothetical protein
MSLSVDERAAFLALMPHLGPEGEDEAVVAFVRDHFYECIDEIGADPGFDQVRAGLIRLVPRLVGDADERRRVLASADRMVRAFPDAVRDGDPTLLLARHPAWVGLCAMELSDQLPGEFPGGVHRAVEVASVGFSALAGHAVSGPGEVLWAMAEQAEEAGWTDRTRQLLEAALDVSFADPANAHRVRILLGHLYVDAGEEALAAAVLEDVTTGPDAQDDTRIHARWMLAGLCQRNDDLEGAREWLREALREANGAGEEDAVEHIKAALGELDPD